MSRSELLPCRCGSPAEIDWGGCTEIAGMCWQVLTISCTNPEQYACYREMTAEIDGDTDSGREIEDALIAAWNRRTPPAQAAEAVVERVARAAYHHNLLHGLEDRTYDSRPDVVRAHYRDLARAAIAAMQAGE